MKLSNNSNLTSGLMSSATDEWATPQDFFDKLDVEFGFSLDVCADDWNHKVDNYFDKTTDGLAQDWVGVCWMNPPYGRTIKEWMKKAYESSLAGATVVCLVPARTDTAWWHDYAMQGEIRFLRGRLKFVGRNGVGDAAPFPSAVVIFQPVELEKATSES
jgi:phage N-6-adenine-methyltransferase